MYIIWTAALCIGCFAKLSPAVLLPVACEGFQREGHRILGGGMASLRRPNGGLHHRLLLTPRMYLLLLLLLLTPRRRSAGVHVHVAHVGWHRHAGHLRACVCMCERLRMRVYAHACSAGVCVGECICCVCVGGRGGSSEGTPSYRGSPHALHGQVVLLLRRQQLHGACGMNTWRHHHLRACFGGGRTGAGGLG